MMAASAVFAAAQAPMTLFGLPPAGFAVAAGSSAAAMAACCAAGLAPLSLPAALAVFAGLWVPLYRRNRRDRHFATVAAAARVLRGRRTRVLIAGPGADGAGVGS